MDRRARRDAEAGNAGQYLIAFRLAARPRRPRAEPRPRPEGEAAEAGERGAEPALGRALRRDPRGARARSGGCCSSRSSRARSGSARPSACAGPTSTPPVFGSGSPGPRRSATVRAGCTCPAWLMEAIEDTCPLEDRVPERRVFQGITEASAYQAMTRACRNAKVPHYHPHDLRHRRITIWHQSGVPARELAERAGHSRPSMSLDVYTHVMPPDEVASDAFSGSYRRLERRPGVVPVWSRGRTGAANPHEHTNVVLVRIVLHRAESSRSLRGNVRRVWELESDGYAAWLRSGID